MPAGTQAQTQSLQRTIGSILPVRVESVEMPQHPRTHTPAGAMRRLGRMSLLACCLLAVILSFTVGAYVAGRN
jgi:hypothetical protein